MQSWVVTGLLTGHNILRRHFYMMRIYSPLCKRCTAPKETSALVCGCETLANTHTNLRSFFSDLENVRTLSLKAISNFIKGTRLIWLGQQFKWQKGPVKGHVPQEQKGLKSIIHSIPRHCLRHLAPTSHHSKWINILQYKGWEIRSSKVAEFYLQHSIKTWTPSHK